MKRRLITIFTIALAAVTLTACTAKSSSAPNTSASSTPTFYFHGWGGTANSTNHLIAYSEQHYNAHKVYLAEVSTKGQVTLKGRWRKSVKNPVIQVIFKNNSNPDLKTDGKWVKAVFQAVNKQHHFSNYNIVAHSMGNLSFMYYVLFDEQTFKAPKLRKQVNIAGHFDGVLGGDDTANYNSLAKSGRPVHIDRAYKEMLQHRDSYPKNQVDILNIYGNKEDGSNSDGSVSNVSSRSLRYLLRGHYKSYVEMMFTGKNAQHSQLHENDGVAKAVGDYLY